MSIEKRLEKYIENVFYIINSPMGRKVVVDPVNREEFEAKICMTKILEFRDRIVFDTSAEYCEGDRRKLADYDLQCFWNWLQTKVKDINI